MRDPMKERLERIRATASSARRRAGLYSEIARMGDGGTASSLGALQRAPAPGKKLQKAGFIMLWIPEPTGVTVAVGAPMILAGRYLDTKYNGATIGDISKGVREVSDTLGSMGRL
ncbi:MAG: hypothetical protein EB832_01020 [Thaumarchaeota archaeon S14]|nr:MAG: hypothetical protein EB832_01020 [Thaumarchaeota archaeon S14]